MNLFELFVKIGVDDQASGQLKNITSSIGNGLKTAAKVGVGAITTVSAGIAGLTKLSIDQYAEYEQLVGGVETLFKDSSDKIMQYANNAYKTAGMSANDYMSTVTSFSASLLQSLEGDTEKATEYANMAITDMADNANKMGTITEMIQNAYQGFAKQNYTMLDNLKLGYGGTKEEMERLVEDAEKLNESFEATRDENGNLVLSFGDVVDAIHIVQTEMGITGTTAKEASETISGSWGMLAGSVKNLLTGFANEEADLGELFDNVVDSAITFGKNLIPRISQVLTSISSLFQEVLPVVLSTFPTIVSSYFENAPEMLKMGADIIASIGKLIVDNLPKLLVSTIQVVTTIANGIADNIDELVPKMTEFILGLVEILTRPELLSPLIQAALAILVAISDGIYLAMTNVEWMRTYEQIILNIFDLLMENLPLIAEAGFQIIVALLSAIVDGWYTQFKSLPNAAQDFADWLTSSENVKPIFEAGVSFVKNLWDGIKSMVKWLYGKLEEIVSNIAEKFNINNIAEKLGLGDLGEVLGTGNIEFNASGIGKVGANAINTINDGISTVANKLGLGEVNLVLPDGTKFAEYLLPDLEGVSKARGTPIVQPK